VVTPAARREAVAHLRTTFEVSERRACKVLGQIARRCAIANQRADDAAVCARPRELAAIRRRFGYRRLLVLMRREWLVMNHKKSDVSIARNGRKSAGVADANGHSAPGRR